MSEQPSEPPARSDRNHWYWLLLVPVVVFVFALLVTLIVRPKIVKTKMNESLKAVE